MIEYERNNDSPGTFLLQVSGQFKDRDLINRLYHRNANITRMQSLFSVNTVSRDIVLLLKITTAPIETKLLHSCEKEEHILCTIYILLLLCIYIKTRVSVFKQTE